MTIKHEDRIARSFRLCELKLTQINAYHNHKKTMANAGIIAQLTVAAGIISAEQYPPDSMLPFQIGCLCVSPQVLSFVAIIAVWALIHVFIRWQLRNRRFAAIFCAALEETLRKWAGSDPDPTDLDPYDPTDPDPYDPTDPDPYRSPKFENQLAGFVDRYLLPCSSATLHSDVSRKGWPSALGKELLYMERYYSTNREPNEGEWLLSLGSVLALLLELSRLFYA